MPLLEAMSSMTPRLPCALFTVEDDRGRMHAQDILVAVTGLW